jgi:hypothetical protein
MGTKEQAIDYLNKEWQRMSKDLVEVNHLIRTHQANKAALLNHMDGLLSAFNALGAKPQTAIPEELQPGKEVSIGDAMEKLLLRHNGEMQKKDILAELRNVGVLTSKNARIILANAIKRDARTRFIPMQDGRVILRKEKERADARR